MFVQYAITSPIISIRANVITTQVDRKFQNLRSDINFIISHQTSPCLGDDWDSVGKTTPILHCGTDFTLWPFYPSPKSEGTMQSRLQGPQNRAADDAKKKKNFDVDRLVVAPCGVLGAHCRFGVTFRLHPQERDVKLPLHALYWHAFSSNMSALSLSLFRLCSYRL